MTCESSGSGAARRGALGVGANKALAGCIHARRLDGEFGRVAYGLPDAGQVRSHALTEPAAEIIVAA